MVQNLPILSEIGEYPDQNICLTTLRRSRKAFLVEYTCGVLLLLLLAVFSLKGIELWAGFQYFVLGLALFSFVYAEFSRMLIQYRIMPQKAIIVNGIIKQSKKNIYFHPLGFVPDINIKQNRIQRVLNYGTIYVQGGSNPFEIKEIDHPLRVMDFLEELIEKNKRIDKANKN
ncbi:MAG: PH domain-containing protein [Nanoarchaeota archaeon]